MMIAARNAFLMGGGKPTARDYVQDGLMAMWDGIENAGWGVHDASATVWKDLIASSNLTIANTAFWTGGCCLANSAAHTLAYRGFDADAVLARYCQIESVFASDNATPTTYGSIIVSANFSNTSADSVSVAVENQTAGLPLNLRFWQGRRGVALAQWQTPLSVSLAKGATSANITYAFINGAAISSFTNTNSGGVGGVVGLTIGGQYAGNRQGGRAFHGKVYTVRLYSRALTADEVAANYAVDAARFGFSPLWRGEANG